MTRAIAFAVLFFWMSVARAEPRQFDMVSVPAGRLLAFWLAPKSSKLDSKDLGIEIGGFKAMSSPVTLQQFETFLKAYPEWSKEKVSKIFADESYLETRTLGQLAPQSPITSVSWFAANAFCETYSMRLPTLFEWEYVAAASESASDANRDPKFLERILRWYGELRPPKVPVVKSTYKNLYGLWDLHGLVWEWVSDFNSTFVTGESREDSTLNKDMFCGAGGMSSANKENYSAFMRFAFRSSLKGNNSVWNLGFRCVKDGNL